MSTAGEEAGAIDERDALTVILALLDWLRGALGFTMDRSAEEERKGLAWMGIVGLEHMLGPRRPARLQMPIRSSQQTRNP